MPNGVDYEARRVSVGTFPIGIDPEKFLTVRLPISDHVIINPPFEGFKAAKGC
jgi:hypothetical protein